MAQDEALGPVELAVIGFPGSQFSGEIAPAVADLVASGTVSILDLLFITRDDDGTVAGFELSEVDDEIAGPYLELEGEAGAFLSEEDMEAIGELLEPGSSRSPSFGRTLGALVRERRAELQGRAPRRTTAWMRRRSPKRSPRWDSGLADGCRLLCIDADQTDGEGPIASRSR